MEYVLSLVLICIFILLVYYAKRTGLTDGLFLLHKKAYKKYQKEVIGEQKQYDKYVVEFCNENIFIHDGKEEITIEILNERNRNYHIVTTLLQKRSDLVIKYFQREEFSYEDFQKLNTEFNTTSTSIEENVAPVELSKQIEDDYNTKQVVGKENPFNCTLNKSEIRLLADCVNEAHIFTTEITPQILEDFFYCQLTGALKSTNNRLLAYFMMKLSAHEYITYEWQSVVANNNLVLAPMKEKYLNASDLSTANDNIKYISPKKSEIIDKFIKQLKKG